MELEHLRRLLNYDQATGVFTWKMKPARRIMIGSIAGSVNNFGGWHYVVIRIDKKPYLAHRLAWFYVTGRWPHAEIDHRDRDGLNNRWDNLREATRSQNAQNMHRHRDNRSGFIGVNWMTSKGKWRAEICTAGRQRHLGLFATAEEASAAYQAAKLKEHI